jgi:hypothetical protein
LIFFFAVLIGTWSWRPDFGTGHGPHLFSSLIINGTETDLVPFPQITICPLWPMGVISNVRCSEGGRNQSGFLMHNKIVMSGLFKDHPDWNCTTINWDGVVPNNSDSGIFCAVNSTNYGHFGNDTTNYSWPGRVIVSVHEPGKLPHHCDDCFDGADFALVEANTTGFINWGAHLFDLQEAKAIEYRTTHNSVSKPLSLAGVETSDMDFMLSYYTKDVLAYREPVILAAAIGGERFGQFITLVGGVGFFSYLLFSCIKTTLILFFLGKDGLTHNERQPII